MNILIQEITTNGYTFKTRTCGLDNSGDMVMFLHGFPESSIIWESTMKILASHGFRCVAFDQRGYSAGARPEGVENYTYQHLCADVVGIADALGNAGKFHLVGHDWGASVTWVTYGFFQERILSLSALSTPHTKAYQWAFDHDEEQIAATGYIRNYQNPGIEDYFAANDFALLRNTWNGFPQEFIDDYFTIFTPREGRTATINWYRSMYLPTDEHNPEVPTTDIYAPTLFIWGNKDAYLKQTGVSMTHPYIKGDYKFVQIDGGSHWLMEQHRDLVIQELVLHLTKHKMKHS